MLLFPHPHSGPCFCFLKHTQHKQIHEGGNGGWGGGSHIKLEAVDKRKKKSNITRLLKIKFNFRAESLFGLTSGLKHMLFRHVRFNTLAGQKLLNGIFNMNFFSPVAEVELTKKEQN